MQGKDALISIKYVHALIKVSKFNTEPDLYNVLELTRFTNAFVVVCYLLATLFCSNLQKSNLDLEAAITI